MMKIELPCYGIVVEVGDSRPENPNAFEGGSLVSSDLGPNLLLDEEDVEGQAAADALESLILAHACAGIDIASPAYVEGIETAVEAIANNL